MTLRSSTEARQTLPRDLTAVLVQLAIALHKYATYPADHPQLDTSAQTLTHRLTAALQERELLAIGVLRHQLLIEGLATDARNPILRALAHRLHRRRVGGLRFLPGLGPVEVAGLLETLARDDAGEAQPGVRPGARSGGPTGEWPHLRLLPMAYDALELAEGSETDEDEATGWGLQLWVGLATMVLSSGVPEETAVGLDPATAEPDDLARVIEARRSDGTYDQEVLRYLGHIGREIAAQPGDASLLRRRTARLVRALGPETLQALIATESDLAARRQFLLDACDGLAVTPVIDLVQASATVEGRGISTALLQLFGKLARHTDVEAVTFNADAEAALRGSVRQLIDEWTLADPNPESYTRALEAIARTGPATPSAASGEPLGETRAVEALDPLRIVCMGLELGVVSAAVLEAVDVLVATGGTVELLELLEQAQLDGEVGEAVWARLARAEHLPALIVDERLSVEALERLLRRVGLTATEPLLDALAATESQSLRRRILGRLAALGPAAAAALVARLPGAPWYVQRNLLTLLDGARPWPAEFTPEEYAGHPDARVRREAVKLMLQTPELRERGVLAALADPSTSVVHVGLAAAAEACPPGAVTRLLAQYNAGTWDEDLRALAIRAVAPIRSPVIRDWLIEQAAPVRAWTGRRRLAARSPEVLGVLRALAAHWTSDPTARDVLERARASADPELRAAARPAPERAR